MKRQALLKTIRKFAKANTLTMAVTEGASHTKVVVGDRSTTVPRHNEINEITAKAILKQIGVM